MIFFILVRLLKCILLFRLFSPARVRSWINSLKSTADLKEKILVRKPTVCKISNKLVIDVSVIHWNDAGTGIQRVVRSILKHIDENPPRDFTVWRVVAQRKKNYHYINANGSISDSEVTLGKGDVFLGLDLASHLLPLHSSQLLNWKLGGAKLHFVVYDLLPITHAGYFTPPRVRHFKRWAILLATTADSLLCISKSVQNDVDIWLSNTAGLTANQLQTKLIHLGGDFIKEKLLYKIRPVVNEILLFLKDSQWALIVGTLEPRKSHACVLDAFELLWAQGHQVTLVIVGKPGWQTNTLQLRLKNHIQKGKKLIWLQDINDSELSILYQKSSGVIVASIAEGYGLPIVEAINYKKPLLIRNISVFKEIAGEQAEYFLDDSAIPFGIQIFQWLLKSQHPIVWVNTVKNPTWVESARVILLAIGISNLNFELSKP